MKIVLSRSGVPIRLTPERMAHIGPRHPEMAGQEEEIQSGGFVITAYFCCRYAGTKKVLWKR